MSADERRPRIRAELEDFEVEELVDASLLGERLGAGEHLYLWVEKRDLNTSEVAAELARRAGVAPGEVGFAGRKDRRAVTRQWLSVPRWPVERAAELALPGLSILDARPGRARLRLGELRGNRFRLRVRGVAPALAAAARERLAELERHGLPNRFGAQRFGTGGANVERGLAVLRGEEPRPSSKRERAFLVSAVQAAAFNRVLDRRSVPCHQLLAGDLAVAHGSGRLIPVDDPAVLAPRLERFAISPTGPLAGPAMPRAAGAVAELERSVLEDFGLADLDAFPGARALRLEGQRRSLRARLRHATAEERAGDLLLAFDLPAGAYATVLLDELFPGGVEEGGENLGG